MQYGELSWNAVPEQRQQVVVLPLGSLEQHGQHLPLLTDSMIAQELARRAEAELGDAALFLPTLWLGASDHHLGFAGTLSLSLETYTRLLGEVLEHLIATGFRRIFLLNAHGGNELPGHAAIYTAQQRHYRERPDLWIAFGSWMDMAHEQIANLAELHQRAVTHACELETSIILKLRPELVTLEAARGSSVPFASAFYVPDFSRPSRVVVPRSFDQLTQHGAFGRPELGTPDKGEALLETATREIVAFIREFAGWQPFQAG